MNVYLIVLGVLLMTLAGWIVTWFRIIREDEHAVVVTLGNPKRVVGSGLRVVIWPFQYLRTFTTNLIKLNFRPATIITKKGKIGDTEYGEANIVIEPSVYFRWPDDEGLIDTLRTVGNPQDEEGLKNLFEETVLDAFRSVGGQRIWRDISQDRKSFADDVLAALKDSKSDPISQAKLLEVQLVIRHLNLPGSLTEAITKPEVARFAAEQTRIEAEANKKKAVLEGEGIKEQIMREGEGYADARAKLFAAIGSNSESLQKETLLTLREMAKGTSNTIFIPTEVADALKGIGKVTNKGDLQSILAGLGLDKTKIDQVMKAIGGEKN